MPKSLAFTLGIAHVCSIALYGMTVGCTPESATCAVGPIKMLIIFVILPLRDTTERGRRSKLGTVNTIDLSTVAGLDQHEQCRVS